MSCRCCKTVVRGVVKHVGSAAASSSCQEPRLSATLPCRSFTFLPAVVQSVSREREKSPAIEVVL